jgi:hypothetical protein
MLRIRDVYHGSMIRMFSISDPNFSIEDPHQYFSKNWFLSLGNMVRVVHPGSWSCFLPIPNPGSRGQKGTGNDEIVARHEMLVNKFFCSLSRNPTAAINPTATLWWTLATRTNPPAVATSTVPAAALAAAAATAITPEIWPAAIVAATAAAEIARPPTSPPPPAPRPRSSTARTAAGGTTSPAPRAANRPRRTTCRRAADRRRRHRRAAPRRRQLTGRRCRRACL